MGDSLLKAKELFWLKGKNGFCKQWSCLNNKTSYNAHRIEIFVWPICSHIARSFHAYKAQFCNWYGIHNLAHKNDYNGISDYFFFLFAKVVKPRWYKGKIQLQNISWQVKSSYVCNQQWAYMCMWEITAMHLYVNQNFHNWRCTETIRWIFIWYTNICVKVIYF